MTWSLLFFKANVSSYDFEGVMNSNNDFILNLKNLNFVQKKVKCVMIMLGKWFVSLCLHVNVNIFFYWIKFIISKLLDFEKDQWE